MFVCLFFVKTWIVAIYRIWKKNKNMVVACMAVSSTCWGFAIVGWIGFTWDICYDNWREWASYFDESYVTVTHVTPTTKYMASACILAATISFIECCRIRCHSRKETKKTKQTKIKTKTESEMTQQQHTNEGNQTNDQRWIL